MGQRGCSSSSHHTCISTVGKGISEKQEHTSFPRGFDPKVAYIILFPSHWPELSHMTTLSCKGGKEISTLPKQPYDKLQTLFICKKMRQETRRQLAAPSPCMNIEGKERMKEFGKLRKRAKENGRRISRDYIDKGRLYFMVFLIFCCSVSSRLLSLFLITAICNAI